MNIRLFRPTVGEEELENLKDVFERAWLGLGPKVSEFEEQWNQYIGAKESIGVNSGTAALHLALTAFGFPRGKKVLVPSMTFISSAVVILQNMLEVVFVDVDRDSQCISMEDLERKYDKDCVAVIAVHFGGEPVDMENLVAFAKAKNLKIIEDCAHCAGGYYKGKKLGMWGDVAAYSFEEKKSMTTGDGGMISSNDYDLVHQLRSYRWCGIDKDTWKRNAAYTNTADETSRHWFYEIFVPGYKFNMNDVMAAIGLAQLKKLDAMNRKRSELIKRYLKHLDNDQLTPLLPYSNLEEGAYWLFGVRSQARDRLIVDLKKKGIPTGVHYTPLHLQPLFRDHKKESLPNCEWLYDRILTLPLHASLTIEEQDYIIEALNVFKG